MAAADARPDLRVPAPSGAGAVPARVEGSPAVRRPLEEEVPRTVASLLRARDARGMLVALGRLVETCGGAPADEARDPVPAIRSLPEELDVPAGRELTLGPVLRALSAAALERAAGELAPPRRVVPDYEAARVDRRESLVALDLHRLEALRAQGGDPGVRWLLEKLRRTLRSLLGQGDQALRYPASRFLIVLTGTPAVRAEEFARRLAWEWDANLGRDLQVATRVEAVEEGDLAGALCRLGASPAR